MTDDLRRPILAPHGASPAEASRPDQLLDVDRYHTYESHPVPWWLTVIWVSFFSFGIVYLLSNMIE
jgi:hypothetical protein